MNARFLKLGPGYWFLWLVLMLVLASKVYLVTGSGAAGMVQLLFFGVAMLAVSYFGAWAIWYFTGKVQKTGELAYLGILTLLFVIRTVMLYSEALAGR